MSGLEGEVVNAHLRFQDNLYNATCLSVGTPNCVISATKHFNITSLQRKVIFVRIQYQIIISKAMIFFQDHLIHTVSGKVFVEFLQEDARMMRVNMGKPAYAGKQLPMSGLEGEVVNARIPLPLHSASDPSGLKMRTLIFSSSQRGPYKTPSAPIMDICCHTDCKRKVMPVFVNGQPRMVRQTSYLNSVWSLHGPLTPSSMALTTKYSAFMYFSCQRFLSFSSTPQPFTLASVIL